MRKMKEMKEIKKEKREKIKSLELRFRCQECNKLVRKGARKCSKCGSYDIDIDV